MAASNAEGNVGVALGLVCGAGAATAIGASVVFFPRLVKLASRRVLAASLGLSAGVMIYVSFVEIFMKSVDEFALHLGVDEEGISDDEAEKRANMGYIYATLSFFGGIVIMLVSYSRVLWGLLKCLCFYCPHINNLVLSSLSNHTNDLDCRCDS